MHQIDQITVVVFAEFRVQSAHEFGDQFLHLELERIAQLLLVPRFVWIVFVEFGERVRTQMHFVTLHEFRSEELIQITRAIISDRRRWRHQTCEIYEIEFTVIA